MFGTTHTVPILFTIGTNEMLPGGGNIQVTISISIVTETMKKEKLNI